MSLARLRSERDTYRWERRCHANWKKIDRLLKRAERHAAKQALRKEADR